MYTLEKIQEEMTTLKEWSLEGDAIVKNFSLSNFREALMFVNKIGEIAEEENHHPDIIINYNTVKLSLSTHSEKGLTEKDFIVARKIDKLS